MNPNDLVLYHIADESMPQIELTLEPGTAVYIMKPKESSGKISMLSGTYSVSFQQEDYWHARALGAEARRNALEAQLENVEKICCAAYVGLGANYNLPVRFLDALCDPLEATHVQIEALLPVEAPPVTLVMNALEAFIKDEDDAFRDLVVAYDAYKMATA